MISNQPTTKAGIFPSEPDSLMAAYTSYEQLKALRKERLVFQLCMATTTSASGKSTWTKQHKLPPSSCGPVPVSASLKTAKPPSSTT